MEVAADIEKERQTKKRRTEMESVQLKDWQKTVIEYIDNQNDREILFIVDKEGGNGKSFLSNYLCAIKNAEKFENGKSNDIKYIFKGSEYIVFDFVRSSQDHINYEIIELLKNRSFCSYKYESCHKWFPGKSKIVVFMNQEPDYSKLSEDRYNVYQICLNELIKIK